MSRSPRAARPPAAHRLPLARRLAFTTLISLLGLVALEAVARHLTRALPEDPVHLGGGGETDFEPDPELIWRERPGAVAYDPTLKAWEAEWGIAPDPTGDVPISSRGFRDEEQPVLAPPGQTRILLLGDSSAWGWGVRRRDTFACRLETALNPPGATTAATRSVEVINTAVPGYSSYQSLVTLGRNLDLGATGLMVYNMISDFPPGSGKGRDDLWFRGQSFGRPTLWSRLALPKALARMRWPWQPAEDVVTSRVTYEHYRANLERMVAIAEAEGMWIVFILPPMRSDIDEHFETADLDYLVDSEALAQRADAYLSIPQAPGPGTPRWSHRLAMALVAWEHHVPLLDGPRLIRGHYLADPGRWQGADQLFVDTIHPAAQGHGLIAEALVPLIQAKLNQARLSQAPPTPGPAP